MKYRKKPVVIEAYQYPTNENDETVSHPKWFLDCIIAGKIRASAFDYLEIETLEGVMKANPGDWIIKGVKQEIYPCKPDIFEATYEKVE